MSGVFCQKNTIFATKIQLILVYDEKDYLSNHRYYRLSDHDGK